MVFRRQYLLILGTEGLGEAPKAEIQAVGHRGLWEAQRIMGVRKDHGRHRGIEGGTEG